jgi:hypothetical protein
MIMTPGVTSATSSVQDITWNILGQTYVPKQLSENSLSWHVSAGHVRAAAYPSDSG